MLGLSKLPAAFAAIRHPTTCNSHRENPARRAASGHQSSLIDRSVSGESTRNRRQILRKRKDQRRSLPWEE